MSKAIIWVLVVVGFFLFILGRACRWTDAWVIGFLMAAGGLYYGLRPGGILRKEQVLDRWGILIANGQGKGEEIIKDTEDFIRESKAPAIWMERQQIAPGIIRGVMGTRREFLVVTD